MTHINFSFTVNTMPYYYITVHGLENINYIEIVEIGLGRYHIRLYKINYFLLEFIFTLVIV